jgi:hypothetical protein
MGKVVKGNVYVAANVAVAPRNGAVGTRTVGGHVQAWRAVKKAWVAGAQGGLPTAGKVVLALAQNPWRAGTPGSAFCNAVLMPLVAKGPWHGTVAQLLAAAQAAGYKPVQCVDDLAWLYTWGVGTFTINGLAHGAFLQALAAGTLQAPAAKAPRKGKAKAAPAQVAAPAQPAQAPATPAQVAPATTTQA